MKPMVEQRKFIRIPLAYVLAVKRMAFSSPQIEEDALAALKNLSANGALIVASKLYAIGDVLVLKINIPGWEKYKTGFIRPGSATRSLPLTVLATVVRVEYVKAGHYEVGVCFVGIDQDHQQALVKLIKKLN